MRYRFPYVSADFRYLVFQPDTSSHCKTTDTDTMCLFGLPTFNGYSTRQPTEGWLRLSIPGYLVRPGLVLTHLHFMEVYKNFRK